MDGRQNQISNAQQRQQKKKYKNKNQIEDKCRSTSDIMYVQ